MPEAPDPLGFAAQTNGLQAMITGVSSSDVIAFTFIYGDPDLAVELVLPAPAFREFAARNHCHVTVEDAVLQPRVQRLIHPLVLDHPLSLGPKEILS